MIEIPGHNFSKLVFLHQNELRTELKKLVTTDPTPGIMIRTSGVPPHIEHTRELRKVLEEVKVITKLFEKQTDVLVGKVCDAIDQKAFDQGNITSDRLKDLLEESKKETIAKVVEKINMMAEVLGASTQRIEQVSNSDTNV